MKQIMLLTSLLFAVFCGVQAQETYYEKHLIFPEKATAVQKLDMASRLIPTPQQLEWQQMEFTAFLHFGINTFTGREWGDGMEDPALFNPTELDCEQWVRALKDGGFKMAIITAKHHDGFCLWPTKTTRHSVASSPWRGGRETWYANCVMHAINTALSLAYTSLRGIGMPLVTAILPSITNSSLNNSRSC